MYFGVAFEKTQIEQLLRELCKLISLSSFFSFIYFTHPFKLRRILSHVGILISIVLMVLVDSFIRNKSNVNTQVDKMRNGVYFKSGIKYSFIIDQEIGYSRLSKPD